MSAREQHEARLIRMLASSARVSTSEYLSSVDPVELRARLATYFVEIKKR